MTQKTQVQRTGCIHTQVRFQYIQFFSNGSYVLIPIFCTEYVLSEKYEKRLYENTTLMAELLGCKTRTARGYGMLLNFVDFLWEEFPAEFAKAGLTRDFYNEYEYFFSGCGTVTVAY